MKRFKKVYIEITNKCNLACSFCFKSKRKPESMNAALFSKILDKIKPYADYVYLHVKGEPFLHPEIGKFLDICYDKGFYVNITTNGTLIKDVKDIILKNSTVRQINFSLHSFNEISDSKNKSEYLGNIFSFVKEALEKTGIIISFRLWNLIKKDGNIIQNPENTALIQAIEKETGFAYKTDEKSVSERGFKISDRLYLNFDHEFRWPDTNDENENDTGFCYALRHHVAVLADGTVVPCCLDADGIMELGNVYRQKFSEIIDGERAKNIYNGFSDSKAVEKLCMKCQYKSRFV